jgi:hypothetical protein
MAENEVTPGKIGHLYYPRNVPGDGLNTHALRVGPTRFERTDYGFLLDSKGIGSWNETEIGRVFRPAPEIGSAWRAKGTSVSRSVLRATETLITLNAGDTFEPGAFFDSFEPVPARGPRFCAGDRVRFASSADLLEALGSTCETRELPLEGWIVRGIAPGSGLHDTRILYQITNPADRVARTAFENRIERERPLIEDWVYKPLEYRALAFGIDWDKFYPPFLPSFSRCVPVALPDTRAALLAAIDTYAARDGEDHFTEALDLNDKIQALVDAHTNHGAVTVQALRRAALSDRAVDTGGTVAVRDARTALENAIETYDALPCGGVVNASPVVLAVDAMIEACRAAR